MYTTVEETDKYHANENTDIWRMIQMVKIIMHGCNGRMGQVITGITANDPEAEIVAGIDVVDCRDNGYPVFTDIDDCDVKADVIIDFAAAAAVDKLLDYRLL